MERRRAVALAVAAVLGGCGSSVEEEAARPVILPPHPRRTPPPAPKPTPDPPGTHRALAYGGDPRQRLDLFVPPRRNAPLVAFVHGGAWIGGGRGEYEAAARAFRDQGFAVATIDYRLSRPFARPGGNPAGDSGAVIHPAHAGDVATALGWLAAHAPEYGYGRRIVVVGHSAGAHIAGTIATTPALRALAREPAAFVGLEGIYDLPDLAARWPGYPGWFLDAAFGGDRSRWSDASPTRRAPAGRAPWLVVHALGDELVDVGQSDDFSAHLRAAGVPVTDLRPEGGSHGSPVGGLSARGDPVAKAVARLAKGGAPATPSAP